MKMELVSWEGHEWAGYTRWKERHMDKNTLRFVFPHDGKNGVLTKNGIAEKRKGDERVKASNTLVLLEILNLW